MDKQPKEEEIRKLAEAHWNFIQKLFEAGGLGYQPMNKLLYIEAMVHGFKHGKEGLK